MRTHHSTSRLFIGFSILIILGLIGFVVFLYAQVHAPTPVQPATAGTPVQVSTQAQTASEENLQPGLVSSTPPPVSSTTGRGYAR